MLGWLSGATQRGAAQAPKDESSSPWVDEPPETPAPVFAVRAFKTALFGTPHPNQSEETVIEEKASPDKPSRSKHSPNRAKFLTPKTGNKVHTLRAQRTTPLVSPAKGILVTPGTATTRRKTVSFGTLDNRVLPVADGLKKQQDSEVAIKTSETLAVGTSHKSPEAEGTVDQPILTKASFKAQLDASKQRLIEHDLPSGPTAKEGRAPGDVEQHEESPNQLDHFGIAADYTVDLTKPRSQSGQHWKAEFERYQRNSDRELRKIIQHGQNVKSYAEKKDIEATELQEKLKRELARCTAMETKVSNLATRLASSKKDGTEGSSEQQAIMNDLSRQTALAIRYKQKADRYRIAIQQQKSSALGRNYDEERTDIEDLTVDNSSAIALSATDHTNGNSELSGLRAELRAFRLKLSIAEERAARLEAANSKLTKNFLRVKDEMNNYDARRLRKETRLKERVDILVAEKKAYETKLKQLTEEHESLLERINEPPVRSPGRQPMLNTDRDSISRNRKSTSSGEHRTSPSGTFVHRHDDGPSDKAAIIEPNFHDIQQTDKVSLKTPAIDIWTMDTPSDTEDVAPPAAESAINLSSIAVSEATHEALRELDQNSILEYPSETGLPPNTPRPTLEHLATMDSHLEPDFPSSEATSAVKRMADRRNTIPSPRPSMVSMASSTVKDTNSPRAATGWRRDASLASAVGSRTSTLNGGRSRLAELPPDRAAAAKARLAQRKSLKEGRRV
ncbi:MAG: hypothetical protein Q9172_007162 [Xanthocarpia lactea]